MITANRSSNVKRGNWTDASLVSSRILSPQRKGSLQGMTHGRSSLSRSGGRQTSPASFSVRTIFDVCPHLNGHSLGLPNTDASVILVSLQGPGLPPLDPTVVSHSAEPRVHVGFLLAYSSVAQTVLDELESQLQAYPSYDIVVCGKVQPPPLVVMSWMLTDPRSFTGGKPLCGFYMMEPFEFFDVTGIYFEHRFGCFPSYVSWEACRPVYVW